MKLTILTDIFKNKISIAERFTGKNITLPILGNILLQAEGQNLKIIATNLEIACVLNINVKINQEGSLTVPARSFTSFIQSLPSNKKLTLEDKNGVLYLDAEMIKSKVNTIPPKDFPLIPKNKKENGITIKLPEFQEALQSVIPAVSSSQIKPELNGIYVSWNEKNKTLTCAATDSFRLAEVKIFTDTKSNQDFSFILPFRSAQEFIHFSSDAEIAELIYGESQIRLVAGDDEIISNTTNGLFPQYTSIIPKKFDTQVEVETKSLIDSVKSTSFFSSRLQDVTIQAQASDAIEVHSENPEIGETTSSLKSVVQGNPVSITFNHKFFLDGLSPIKSGKIILSLNNESSPALIRGTDNPSYMYLIMPLKGM